MPEKTTWYLYLIECRSGAYYAGITNDLEARYRAHADGKGARYTRANPPVALLRSEPFESRRDACRAEASLKKLTRERKLSWARGEGKG